MQPTTIRHRINWLSSVDSTNNEANRHYGSALDGEVWAADFQESGRGQQGNSWESEAGKNLLFSLFFRPSGLPAAEQFRLLQVVSLGVCDALRDKGIPALIKWPNDIYVGRKKIAGILIEHHITGVLLSSSVAGIGLNVNQALFCSAPNPTSVCLESGHTMDRKALLADILSAIDRRYAALQEIDALHEDYLQRLLFYTQWADYSAEGGCFKARIVDVLPTGELELELEGGSRKSFLFKCISLCL